MDLGQVWETLESVVLEYGLNLVFALLIFFIGWWLARVISSSSKRILLKRHLDPTLAKFVGSLMYGLLIIFVIIAALGRLGVQTASLVAVLGAAGLAIGLALQGSLANFAAGVLMIVLRPFKVGDYITAGGSAGSVLEIGMFTTRLRSPDNKIIIVPNTKIMGDTITNYTAESTRRMDLIIGVGYDDDLHLVQETLTGLLASHIGVLAEPAPFVGVLEFADSSVNFVVRPWVNTSEYWNVYFALHQKIKDAFDEKGITIPYPQTDVHLHTLIKE